MENNTVSNGVARSLHLGGQSASAATMYGGPGACHRKNFGGHALETLGKRGKRPSQLYFASQA